MDRLWKPMTSSSPGSLETAGADRALRDLGQFASNLMIHVSVVSTCL